MANEKQTIVIKRGKKHKASAHGGSWKIAFADFALAMMAFFLVLWLIESTTELEKSAIAGYFSDPRSLAEEGDGGTPYVLDLGGRPLDLPDQGLNLALVREDQEQVAESPEERENPEYMEVVRLRQKEVLEGLAEDLEEAMGGEQEFEWFNDSVRLEQTEDGLSIQIVDRENRPLFGVGSDRLQPFARELMWLLAAVLRDVPNRLTVYGHTDALPFSAGVDGEYSNWELSTDRAHAARRALVEGGLESGQFAQIVGMGDSVPFDPDDPSSAANRRIVLLVMNELYEQQVQNSVRRAEEAGVPGESLPEVMPAPEIF